MKSDIYNNDECTLDIENNLVAAGEWSFGVMKATKGVTDFGHFPSWSCVLAFGSAQRPDLCLSRARFASRAIELEAEGKADLSNTLVPSSSWTFREFKSDGKNRIEITLGSDENGFVEEADALEFYRACHAAYSLYYVCASAYKLASMPVPFETGWQEKKSDIVNGFKQSESVGKLIIQGMAVLQYLAMKEQVPAGVSQRDPSRFDKEYMGLAGVIRGCCNFLTVA